MSYFLTCTVSFIVVRLTPSIQRSRIWLLLLLSSFFSVRLWTYRISISNSKRTHRDKQIEFRTLNRLLFNHKMSLKTDFLLSILFLSTLVLSICLLRFFRMTEFLHFSLVLLVSATPTDTRTDIFFFYFLIKFKVEVMSLPAYNLKTFSIGLKQIHFALRFNIIYII